MCIVYVYVRDRPSRFRFFFVVVTCPLISLKRKTISSPTKVVIIVIWKLAVVPFVRSFSTSPRWSSPSPVRRLLSLNPLKENVSTKILSSLTDFLLLCFLKLSIYTIENHLSMNTREKHRYFTFKRLSIDHMQAYVSDGDNAWQVCTRVKNSWS